MESRPTIKDDLLLWAKDRKGNLRAIQRKNGVAYFFRYRLGGTIRYKNFPPGTDQEFIKAFIAETESNALKEKLGLIDFSQPVTEKPKRLTVYELLEWYIRSAVKESMGDDRKEEARTYSYATIRRNEYAFKRFIRYLKSDDYPSDTIEKRHLYDYRRHLAERGWMDRSIKGELDVIKNIFKKAFDEGVLLEYKFWGFKVKHLSKQRPRDVLTFAEMKAIYRMIKDKYVRLTWLIGMYSGMRYADIARIKKENINHDKRTIIFWMAKRREWIELPLRDELIKILSQFKDKTGPLLADQDKKKMGYNRVMKIYSRAIQAYKGKNFHVKGPHTLRHSFSHIMDLNGIKWEDQQFLLGHKIKAMTGRYKHPEKRMIYFSKVLNGIKFDIAEEAGVDHAPMDDAAEDF